MILKLSEMLKWRHMLRLLNTTSILTWYEYFDGYFIVRIVEAAIERKDMETLWQCALIEINLDKHYLRNSMHVDKCTYGMLVLVTISNKKDLILVIVVYTKSNIQLDQILHDVGWAQDNKK